MRLGLVKLGKKQMKKDVELAVQKAIEAVGVDTVKQMSMFVRGRETRPQSSELLQAA
jgi:hypothetical protein